MARAAQLESGNQNGVAGAFPPHVGADQLPKFAVRHYTVAEIATMWSLSADAVRKIFEKEPGVLVLGETQPRRGKRRYTTLRIPEFVLERVHRKLSRI
jgi:hypothetical protein